MVDIRIWVLISGTWKHILCSLWKEFLFLKQLVVGKSCFQCRGLSAHQSHQIDYLFIFIPVRLGATSWPQDQYSTFYSRLGHLAKEKKQKCLYELEVEVWTRTDVLLDAELVSGHSPGRWVVMQGKLTQGSCPSYSRGDCSSGSLLLQGLSMDH